MRRNARAAAAALLAACVAFGIPCAGVAQTTMTGKQEAAMMSRAMQHFDRETQTLATMRNHISSRDIVTVAVVISDISISRRSGTAPAVIRHHAALVAALGRATVADVDRNNGQSEDSSSLAEYLQHLGIDPNKVVMVDIDPKHDRQNPRVTVFYRR